MPRFSIVLPTHNRADVLPFAIRSALWQTEPDFELLVVGDGCTDRTPDVVRAIQDPRIRWLDLPKADGVGYAHRNVALRQAQGRFIAYLAHDDIWFPDHLSRLGECLENSTVDFAYSRGLAVATDGIITPYWCNLAIPSHRSALRSGGSAITMCTVAHTKQCLDKFGYWDETLARSADKEMWRRILEGGRFERFAFLAEPTTLHFVAAWRKTPVLAVQESASRILLKGVLRTTSPAALRLPSPPGMTQQQAAWEYLAAAPAERVARLREAVVQVQDAVMWRSKTSVGLLGLGLGLVLGAALERVARAGLWLASPGRRRSLRELRRRTAGSPPV
jgi:hypothetical protein